MRCFTHILGEGYVDIYIYGFLRRHQIEAQLGVLEIYIDDIRIDIVNSPSPR